MNLNRVNGYPKWYYGTDITEYWKYVSEPHRKYERWRFDLSVPDQQVQQEREKWQQCYEAIVKESFHKSLHVDYNVYKHHASFECVEQFKRTEGCFVSIIESGSDDRNIENPCPKLIVDYYPSDGYDWQARAVFALCTPVKLVSIFYNDYYNENVLW